MKTEWNVCELGTGVWRKVGERFVEDLADTENIKEIYEHGNGDIEVHYNNGETRDYQKIHGNFIFNY